MSPRPRHAAARGDAMRKCSHHGCPSSYDVRTGPVMPGWKVSHPSGAAFCPIHADEA